MSSAFVLAKVGSDVCWLLDVGGRRRNEKRAKAVDVMHAPLKSVGQRVGGFVICELGRAVTVLCSAAYAT
jgi:hypothetical protein